MQVNRLFEIIYILLNKDNVTAKELAENFEVSQRTIYRDIEVLCQSGIPIYTSQGKGGGIRLLDNFILNKSLLSKAEQEEIISALQGLSATNYPDTDSVLSKLSNLFGTDRNNWIEVDFSDWSGMQKEKFNLIKYAILQKQILAFEYFSTYGDKTYRTVEPLKLWFKNKTWYLKAYCRLKEDMRTFKLNRIKQLELVEEYFDRKIIEKCNTSSMEQLPQAPIVELKLRIHSSLAYRVYDEFEEEQINKDENGDFIVHMYCPEDEWVYGYVLSYGYQAEALEPAYIRDIIKDKLIKTLSMYER